VSIVTALVAVWVFCGVIVVLIATYAGRDPVVDPRDVEDRQVQMLDEIWELPAWRP
jgi:hypothetical protein